MIKKDLPKKVITPDTDVSEFNEKLHYRYGVYRVKGMYCIKGLTQSRLPEVLEGTYLSVDEAKRAIIKYLTPLPKIGRYNKKVIPRIKYKTTGRPSKSNWTKMQERLNSNG